MLTFTEVANLAVDAIKEVRHGPRPDPGETEEQKRDRKIKAHFNEMVENTSFHGINYINDSRYSIRRVIWLVITTSAFVYALLKVYESTMMYLDYPSTTAIMRRYVDSLIFPAISFCNLNDMRLSVMQGTQIDKAIIASDMSLLENVTSEEFTRQIESAKHRLSDMLVECVFDGKVCSHTNFTEFPWSQGDRCWTFNSGKRGEEYISVVTGAGPRKSLMLTLNIQHFDYYRDGSSAGVHLMIHGQDQTPVRIQGPIMSPGFSHYIQVDKTLIINLKAPYKTRCGSLKLKYFKKYSYDACWLEQLTEYVERSCSCKESFMPGDSIPICSGPQYYCLWEKWEQFEQDKLWNCPLPCELDMFQYRSMSRTIFPSQSYAHELNETLSRQFPFMRVPLSKSRDIWRTMRDHLLRLVIYYDDMSLELQEQKPSYDFASFLGDIGGQFSLFVGAGVMSYFELVDCVAMILNTKYFEGFKPAS